MTKPSNIKSSLSCTELCLHGGMAVLLVAGISFGLAIRYSLAQDVDRLMADTAECESLSEQEKELTEAVALTAKRSESLEKEYANLLERIPKKMVDSDVLASIRNTALNSKCSLNDFRPTQTVEHKEFKTRSFELHIEGSFSSLFQCFESMRDIPFAYHLSRFNIKEPTKPGGACHANMELNIVFDHKIFELKPGQNP